MEYDEIIRGYTIINGFGFKTWSGPRNVNDTIIIKGKYNASCDSPDYDIPYHTIEDYTALINRNQIQKAIIILEDLSHLHLWPSLKFINIQPSERAPELFDFSPLYQMPEIKALCCQNKYRYHEQYISEIDYSRIHGLVDLGVCVNKGTLNYNRVKTLKSLGISGFKGQNRDLTDLFCSRELDTLQMIQCGMHSLNGIETSRKMQCLYLYYNRSLRDINALRKVKSTLKALRIENCPKIEDFSVLGELENLEFLELSGKNILPSLDFLKTMKNLKYFMFDMNVMDGDLTPCLNISCVESVIDRRHYNLKDRSLSKGKFTEGNEDIEEWRRL